MANLILFTFDTTQTSIFLDLRREKCIIFSHQELLPGNINTMLIWAKIQNMAKNEPKKHRVLNFEKPLCENYLDQDKTPLQTWIKEA